MHLKFLSTNSKTTVLFLGIPCRGILLLILQSINLLELPNKLLQNEWLTQQKCIVSCFWRLKARDQSFKGWVPSEPGKETLFPASLPASGGFLSISDIDRLVMSLPSFPHGILLVCVQSVSFY